MTVKQYVKRILSMFLVFCLIAGSMLVVSPQEAHAGLNTTKVEHFPNGDFENASFDYSSVCWTDANGSYALETENNGNRVYHVKELKPNGCFYVGFSMEANKTYTISFDIKATAEERAGLFHLFTHSWGLIKAHHELKAEWKQYTYEYTPTKAETGLIFQNNPQASGNIDFYIDNFSVTTLEEAKPVEVMEYIPNGDFENTEYDYTQTWRTDANESYSLQTESEGNRVLHVKDLKPNGCVYVGVSMKANKTYTISFDIKATAEEGAGLFHLFTNSWGLVKAHQEIKAEGKRYTYEYTPTKAETGLIFQNNPQASGNIDFYIDNVSVTSTIGENVKTTLSKTWLGIEDGKNAYTMHLGVSNYAELIAEFGEGSWFEGEILINGTPTKSRFNLGDNVFATFDSIPQGTTSIEIPLGTEFIDEDGSSSKLLVTDNKFTLSIEKPKPVEVMEYIPNGDFENTEYDYTQTWWTDGNGSYSLETESNGNRVLHVKDLKPNGCVYVGVNMKANKTYTISFDIKATAEERAGLFHLFTHSWDLMKAHQEVNAEGKRYTYEYTPTKAETGLIFQHVGEATANIDFYIDNVSVTSTIGENVKTTLSKTWLGIEDGKNAYTMHLGVSNYAELIAEFGEGSWFEGEILIDGLPTKSRFNLDDNVFVTFDSIPQGTTSIKLPIGTEFIDEDGSSSKLLVTEHEFTLNINEPKPEVYNDIKISFDSINGEAGFYFKAEIVDGPDKGKIIGTEAYGEWMSPGFGAASYSVEGEMTEMNISYSPVNDQIYISGFPKLSTLDGITLKEGTIIRPIGTAQNVTPMRIVNTIEMEQDKVYGRWGYKGQIQTPTEFYDVVVSVEKVGSYWATLIVEFADGSKKNLSEIYGENVALTGTTQVVDPELGTYSNKGTQYVVQSNGTMFLCVDFAMPDSVEVKAGTVLWPSQNSEVQKPVRILNRIYLDRDAEDEWVVRVGAVGDAPVIGDASAGGNSPQTGDETPIMVYASIFVGAIVGISACVYWQKKRRQQV